MFIIRFMLVMSLAFASLRTQASTSLLEPEFNDTTAVEAATDATGGATRPGAHRGWVRQLVASGFHINDTTIHYPRFARFLLNVYNWGDRTFNGYDTTYVVSTGKNWKLLAKNDNWMESFLLLFPKRQYIRMMSDPYFDLGTSLNFMAVSLSYMQNAKTLFAHTIENRHRYDFSFTCGLFSASLHYSTTEGGAKILRFCDYDAIRQHHMNFNDISTRSFYVDAYYFFNHRRYSQAAAYCYSKYQLKSAGTWLAGFVYTRQNVWMDFSSLPQEMLDALPTDDRRYMFHYRDYSVTGGYAYNLVLKPRRWLLNVTLMPSVGLRRSYEDSTEGEKDMFSTSLRGMFGVVYNHRSLFAAVNGNFLSHIYHTSSYTFVNTDGSLTATVGVRF